jgi:Subtilase family
MNRFLVCLTTFAVAIAAHAQVSPPLAPVPENLGLGLRQLVEISQSDQAELKSRMSSAPSVNADSSGRVVVNIQLNGAAPLPELEAKLVELGLEIIATDSQWRAGVISAWLPLSQAVAAANLPGVRSVTLAPRPRRRAGVVTAESAVVERSAEVNAAGVVTAQGILGRGISVGLISDSYNGASGVPRASAGVAAGDLPGPGNPDGYTQPVVVLKDDTSAGVTDEGRGMAEIVHDIAPAAKICFSTAGLTEAAMAASIRNLRTSSQTLCDVIVDDIGFADEPFFSDGLLSQAIDDVATSNSLAGKKAAYFSAAGNSTNRGYTADANIISPKDAQPYYGNLRLPTQSSLYAGGFQNLNATGTPAIAMTVTTDADPTELVLQWDDPFNTGSVTTDYNVLVFNSNGSYLGSISGTDNNFSTSEPIEIVDLSPNTTYQIAISLASNASPTARHLRLICSDGSLSGDHLTGDVISLIGHPSATNANAVAAYMYDDTPDVVTNYNPAKSNPPPGPYEPVVESFNARGGSLPFYFDSQGQRLSSPQIRIKPEFAAADGVDTSFFPTDAGSDTDNDGYPNFFGTSAAAPNAGAFAALLLEAAGGPASLTPGQVRTFLQQSTFPHDLDPNISNATITASGRTVSLAAAGDDSNESATSPNFFTLTFNGQSGDNLSQVVIDLSNTAVIFDPRTDLGFPFTVGQASAGLTVTPALSSDMRTLTLSFSGFTPGKSISFGIDRDLAAISASGNSADVLGGASVSAVINGQTLYGAFVNQLGTGFIPSDGNGLIDARVAVEAIVGKKAGSGGAAVNLSTRGNVGAGENVLIGGLIIEGSASKKLILRAIGPSLTAAGVSGALSDPLLELHDSNGQQIAADDNWQDDPAQAALIRGTGIPPNDPRESALVETLSAGNYTAIVRGSNNATGIGLVEAYDLDSQPAASRLANIATRGTVQTGDNVMIAGFILQQGASRIVVRALGPSLTAAGVSGALPDPSLELRDSQGNLLLADDNWQEHAFQAVQLTAVGLSPTGATESALTTTLNSGNYTAIVRGSHGATGVALVEVYNLR